MKRAYLILNLRITGSLPFYQIVISKAKGDILCVDGGSRHLQSLHILPKELWGDLDSTSFSTKNGKTRLWNFSNFLWKKISQILNFSTISTKTFLRGMDCHRWIGRRYWPPAFQFTASLYFISETAIFKWRRKYFPLPKHYVLQSLQEHKHLHSFFRKIWLL